MFHKKKLNKEKSSSAYLLLMPARLVNSQTILSCLFSLSCHLSPRTLPRRSPNGKPKDVEKRNESSHFVCRLSLLRQQLSCLDRQLNYNTVDAYERLDHLNSFSICLLQRVFKRGLKFLNGRGRVGSKFQNNYKKNLKKNI